MKKAIVTSTIFLTVYSFCTRNTLSDADGNTYQTVRIGNQVWMAENYRSTKFNDGTPIPYVADSIAWHALTTPGYCYYGNTNNTDTIKAFGALYNWYCVGLEKFAPPGWRVPTDDDWDTLQEYLIKHGYNWDGDKRGNRIAKSMAARSGWNPYSLKGMPGHDMKSNNRSGFSAIPAGRRNGSRNSAQSYSVFELIGHTAAWWSATENNESSANVYAVASCVDYLIKYQHWPKNSGYSVRLVKNMKK